MARTRLEAAISAFDRLNSGDPTTLSDGGHERPRELVQAERLTEWVLRLEPEPSLALVLAARCQHLMRWKIPRADFPSGRSGYHRWRRRAMEFHATESARVLRDLGFEQAVIDEVRRINSKEGLRENPDVQTMEDALCLSFIQHELDDFADKHDDAKMVRILRETWRKMSPRAREFAPKLSAELSERARALFARALHTS